MALNGCSFYSYSERPTTASKWASFITSPASQQGAGGPIYQMTLYQLTWDGSSNRAGSSYQGYVAFGNNTSNTSFDVFFVATTDMYGEGPFYFNSGSSTSKPADFGGKLSSGGYFGVWKIGTIYASSRNNPVSFSDFYLVAMKQSGQYLSTDTVTVSTALKNIIQSGGTYKETPPSYGGCLDITTSMTIPATVTMGTTSITANVSTVGAPVNGGLNMYMYVLSNVQLTTGTSSLSWNNKVLPYTLEQYFNDKELRRQTNIKCVFTYPKSQNASPVFINGVWQPYSGQYEYTSSNFYLQINTSRLPTISSVSGTKETNHKSQYVMLCNGYDKVTIAATVTDQSYPYNNDPNNYSPTFALYIGDANQGNYNPTKVTSTAGNLVATYNFTYGPMTVNPAVSLGTNQYFRAVYQDRFGREASANISLKVGSSTIAYQRFYNYINPTFGITARRVNASGTPDEREGTYIKIDYNWAASLLDYAMSPHTGTVQPTIKITNNQDSTTNSYTLTQASGSGTFTLSNKSIDKSYTFTALFTDAAGREYTLTAFVPSGSVILDFLNGGSGLGIGMRAEMPDKLSIGWATQINNMLSAQKTTLAATTISGGLTASGASVFNQALEVKGTLSGPTITDIYNKIKAAGESSSGSTTGGTAAAGTILYATRYGFYIMTSSDKAIIFQPILDSSTGYATNSSFTTTFGGSWAFDEGAFKTLTPLVLIHADLKPVDYNAILQYTDINYNTQTITWQWILPTGVSGSSTKRQVRGYAIYTARVSS